MKLKNAIRAFIFLFCFSVQPGISKAQIQFEEVLDAPFMPLNYGAVATFDADNDGDIDVLMTGRTFADYGNPMLVSYLYLNDAGTFTLDESTPFIPVWQGSISIADVTGNGYKDVLLTGRSETSTHNSHLYLNNGGSFDLVENLPFIPVRYSASSFSDVDGDGDQDVLIMGETAGGSAAELYINESGQFSVSDNNSFPGAPVADIAFFDMDNDGDKDLLIQGGSGNSFDHLYENDGLNGEGEVAFSLIEDTPFIEIDDSPIGLSDVDQDGDLDILMSAENETNLYINELGEFTLTDPSPFVGLDYTSINFFDVDQDGDEDVLLSGKTFDNGNKTFIYLNDSGIFSPIDQFPIFDMGGQVSAVFDADADGDKDILIMGFDDQMMNSLRFYLNTTSTVDTDDDGIYDGDDNCVDLPNPDQIDIDDDGIGDLCDDCIGELDTLGVCNGFCSSPYLAVNSLSLSTEITENAVITSWDPVADQIGCQIQVKYTDGTLLGNQIIQGANADGFTIPGGALEFNTEYGWRVRCGCSQDPLIVGPFSTWQIFTTPEPPGIMTNPNPTTGLSNVSFYVSSEEHVSLEVFDINGKLIKALYTGVAQPANEYRFQFDGAYLPNGLYIYRLTTESEVVNEKFLIAK